MNIGTNLLASAFGDSRLRSGTARTIGHALVESNARTKQAQFEAAYHHWVFGAERTLNLVSVAKPNMSLRGNSGQLISRFANAQTGAKVATRLARSLRVLESIAAQTLVYNGEIPTYLKDLQTRKAEEKRLKSELRILDIPEIAPGFDSEKFPNRVALHGRLSAFPVEREMIEGAIDAFSGDGPDRNRQALSSARNALESMAKRITGAEQWRNAIGAVAGDSTKRIFRDVFDFLSARGSHAGKTPTKAETEFGIQQTISCVLWLASHQTLFKRT